MRIHRHWARATVPVEDAAGTWMLECCDGSDTSVDDARRRAELRAQAAAAAIRSGAPRQPYGYADRPLREEIVDVLPGGEREGVLTRNAYGSLVLNTPGVFFADIDEPPGGGPGLLGRLFGRKAPDPTADVVARLESVLANDHGLGARLYCTAAGWRVLVTTRTFDPASDESTSLLEALDSDPLYVRLCRSQACYRARLTPKFWRCSAPAPPARFPFDDARTESRYRAWETEYARRSESRSTCTLLGTYGRDAIDPAVTGVVDAHDRLACTGRPRLA